MNILKNKTNKPMKRNPLLLAFCLLFSMVQSCAPTETSEAPATTETEANGKQYFQIRTYTFANETQEALTDAFLENAFLPALKRQGISPVGVFKLRPESLDSFQQTFVLIPFDSMEEFATLEAKLDQDEDFLKGGTGYLDANYDQPPYLRMESTLLYAFDDMPLLSPSKVEGPRSERIYELRSYESATEAYHKNKVDMFNAGGEVVLFDKLGFNAVFYGSVISGPKMPNLMYMTTFSNQASRDEHWKSFVDAPEWKEMSSLDKYQNNVSHIDIYFLYPTEYSDY
jgi:hypothetical protein